MMNLNLSVKDGKGERRKKKRREKNEDRIRNRGQEQGLEISQNEILSSERNVKEKGVNLEVGLEQV